MEVSNQIQLKFYGVDFPIINLNSNKSILVDNEKININIIPKVFYPNDKPQIFKIFQEVHLSLENNFNLYILAIGTFELNAIIEENIKKSYINTNAPAIMFPYIRSFISTLTANLGNVTGPLTIPTQFFNGVLEEILDM